MRPIAQPSSRVSPQGGSARVKAPQPSSAPTLRPYQTKVVNGVYEKISAGFNRIGILAGTGAGKTVISGQICAHARRLGLRLMFVVHLDVLVGQTADKLRSFGLECGFIKAGWKEDPTAPIQIASVQTLAQRDWWRDWQAQIVFYDEAHTTLFSQVGQEILEEVYPRAVHLAMTATPYRLGQGQLGDLLQTYVAAPVPSELQRMGFLAPMRYFGLPAEGQVELGEVTLVDGDFEMRGLKNACDRPELITRVVEEWCRLTPNKRTIAFCVDVEHAKHVAEAFNDAGIPADMVAGSTSRKDRQRLYSALGAGELMILTSCNVISIGFDEPSVEVGLLLRPTQSTALHQQQIGRVMRISPKTGKVCGLILDQAGNLSRLGFPEDIERYDLPVSDDDERKVPVGRSKLKGCPDCGAWVNLSAVDCPECPHSWASEPTVSAQDLIELWPRERFKSVDDVAILCKLFHYLRQQNYSKGRAPHQCDRAFYQLTNRLPEENWYSGAIFGIEPTSNNYVDYKVYLERVAFRLKKDLTWAMDEFKKEFGHITWS
ncbi:MAG: DEAD/DEAH box helicase [Cyanophyceae cyanobacterium]